MEARQLGVKTYMSNLAFSVFWNNTMLMRLLVRFGVECKCQVLFDNFYVYFIATDATVAIMCHKEVAIHRLAGLNVANEDLRNMLFNVLQSQTACERVSMTVKEYNALVAASSRHMTTFFRQHRPSYEEYDVYVRVCEFFGITPYTSWTVVSALWSMVATLRNASL